MGILLAPGNQLEKIWSPITFIGQSLSILLKTRGASKVPLTGNQLEASHPLAIPLLHGSPPATVWLLSCSTPGPVFRLYSGEMAPNHNFSQLGMLKQMEETLIFCHFF